MKKLSKAAAALALLLGSCSAPYSPVQLFQVCAFPTPSGGSCTYSATCSLFLAGPALLDVTASVANPAYQGPFMLAIQINNELASSASATNGTVNANDAYVQTFEVSFSGTNLSSISVPVTVTVPAGGSATYVVPLIPASYFASLPVAAGSYTHIVLDVKATGTFLSQESFTTQTLQIPVYLCSDCLLNNPTSECAGAAPTGLCPGDGYFQTNTPSCG
jgi:hypothetical protein